MTPDANQAESVFAAALEKPVAERSAYLDAACAGDDALRRRVEALLAAQEQAGSLLEGPVLDAGTAAFAGAAVPEAGASEAATVPPEDMPPAPAVGAVVRYFGDYELLE